MCRSESCSFALEMTSNMFVHFNRVVALSVCALNVSQKAAATNIVNAVGGAQKAGDVAHNQWWQLQWRQCNANGHNHVNIVLQQQEFEQILRNEIYFSRAKKCRDFTRTHSKQNIGRVATFFSKRLPSVTCVDKEIKKIKWSSWCRGQLARIGQQESQRILWKSV